MSVLDDLTQLLHDEVEVVIQSDHHPHEIPFACRLRGELPAIRSHLYPYEELLIEDGHTCIAFIGHERSSNARVEVTLSNKKLFALFGSNLEPFESSLREHDIPHDPTMIFANESPYVNRSTRQFLEQFNHLVEESSGCSWDAEDPFSHA